MNNFSVHLFDRDFSEILTPMRLSYSPTRMSWAAIGGPSEATIHATGPEIELWELVERLRCPVQVVDPTGKMVWWGYIQEISIRAGAMEVSVSLEKMSNRICVTYSEVNTAGVVGERKTTTWYQDDDSAAAYGTKEQKLSKNQATADEAINYAQTSLQRLRYPIPAHRMGGGGSGAGVSGEIRCVGWWQTLDWRYYADTGGKVSYEESGNDLTPIGNAAGQTKLAQSFLVPTGTTWQANSIKLHLKREGSPTDNLTVSLCADHGGEPEAITLASASLAGTSVSENLNWHEFVLSSRVGVTPGMTYWVVVARSGSLNGSNYYRVDGNEDIGYTDGVMRRWNGSAWVARSPNADMLFVVGGVEETTAQISRILSNSGQFVSGVDVDVSSGVYSSPYRDGDQTALAITEELLDSGSSNQRRLLAAVTAQRRVVVTEEPASGQRDYLLQSGGEMRDWLGKRIPKWDFPAGVWARLADVIPASADIGLIADPSRVFLEQITYDVDGDTVSLRERDASRLLELS